MEDLIRRSDAIEAIKAEECFGFIECKTKALIDDIDAIPSADIDLSGYSDKLWKNAYERGKADIPQDWIPCSERLPSEEKATYLVCTDSEYMCSCRWTNTNPIWTDLTTEWHWCIFDIPQYSKVVAWMPLKPWKGADDEYVDRRR